ncbi:MAG: CPBP family intramembrane glutamic endopeptidase [Litorilinea sp.]
MNLQYTAFVIATLFLASLLGYAAYRSAQLLQHWRPPRNPMLMGAENAMRLFLVIACILLGWASGLDRQTLGWTWDSAARQALYGLGWGLGLALIFGIATRRLIAHTGRRYYSPLVMELILPKSTAEFGALALAMIPAVLLEELLYRSLLIGGLSPHVSPALLIVGVGLLFGLLHTPQGTWGVLGAGLAGMLFGVLFVWEGSLLLPVVAHYVANMAQIAWVYARPGSATSPTSAPDHAEA